MKRTTRVIKRMKTEKDPIVMLTAYDYPIAKLLDQTDTVDILLVGDSLGMVIQGKPNTLHVTLEHMLYHTSMVARAAKNALVVADMPFMSYQVSIEQGITSAGRFLQEAQAHAVKLEGASEYILTLIKRLVSIGIPVMGHIGLTPQFINEFGGWVIQGRTEEAKQLLLKQAQALENAGVFSIVLEGMPSATAKYITENVSVPTIGIGAGPHCDGQVLVITDILGLGDFKPKFVKPYANLNETITNAVMNYAQDVKTKEYPGEKYTYD